MQLCVSSCSIIVLNSSIHKKIIKTSISIVLLVLNVQQKFKYLSEHNVFKNSLFCYTRKMKQKLYFILGIVALIIIVALLGLATNKSAPIKSNPNISSANFGTQDGKGPWIAERANLKARLLSIGLPALSAEGTVMHIHQHLDIFINGNQTPVPAEIGIGNTEHFISPLHTHDNSNIIHVESPTVEIFTLGQFFDVWGLKLSRDCIGGYCADATKKLSVYVNGELQTSDPRSIKLAPHQEIAIIYGTKEEAPKVIPSSFEFPAGL